MKTKAILCLFVMLFALTGNCFADLTGSTFGSMVLECENIVTDTFIRNNGHELTTISRHNHSK